MSRVVIAVALVAALLSLVPIYGFAGSSGSVDAVPPPPRATGGGGFNAYARPGGGGFDDRPVAAVTVTKSAIAAKK